MVANETLDLHATTFRTEAAKIVAAHPDAIMTEALGYADPTLFAEIKQLNGGKMIPIIGTSAAISPVFYAACAKAVGAAEFSANFHADNLVTATSGPAYDAFTQALLAVKGKVSGAQTGDFTTYFTAPGAVHLYDGMNLAALAMVAAGSTDTAKWKPWIATIGDGVPGAVVVNSFAQGVAELKAGKKIRYVGPGGPTSFDAYHDSPGIFQIDTYSPTGAVVAGISPQPAPAVPDEQPAARAPRARGDRPVSLLLASVGFGLITSAVLAIAAVGFTLQFAVTDVLNLAFAAVMTAGAFIAYLVNQAGLSVWVGLVAAMAAARCCRCC